MKTLGRFEYAQTCVTLEGNLETGTFIVQTRIGPVTETKAFQDGPSVDALFRSKCLFESAVHTTALRVSRADLQQEIS
jgi:hypothetical protein